MSIDVVALSSDLHEAWVRMMGRGTFEVTVLRIFAIVAEANGQPVQQAVIRERLGIVESTASRNISLLSKGATFTSPGPRLIESYDDPTYPRRKLVRLTAKGKNFLNALQSIVDKHARNA